MSSGLSEGEYCTSLEDVRDAYRRIRTAVVRTPVLEVAGVEAESLFGGTRMLFKVEALQKTGSFKLRGALNAVIKEIECRNADKDASSQSALQIVTHSSGNHAQAIAFAACLKKQHAVVIMPRSAPVIKKQAVQSLGGELILVDNTLRARREAAQRAVEQRSNAVFIHSSEHPSVIAGQGTVCLELLEQLDELNEDKTSLDVVIIPVGGGGLAAGNAVSVRGVVGRRVKIVLAEPEKLDDAKRSFQEGKRVEHESGNDLESVADALKTTLGENTWRILRDLVDEVVTVSEEEILRATRWAWEKLKVCIEPSAGVGVAVAMSEHFKAKYNLSTGVKTAAVVLCGGNVDIAATVSKMQASGVL
eukprot:CAMPEP_0185846520 /NCGR_PEP_ID=MMETSP1354-20130828/2122_1 /TAXON_ID=708628 /ORGANISM="Erythrolobus madagascarensis, Strain CCMP3276" /LENGTH=360 /DNA_ID=CAMNT_0028546659 /DNA_START=34 /DNA_END=1116 /DNA_ORIENTATION=-